MYTVKIDDSQLNRFLKESPRRANWALKESLKAAGYHLRKRVRRQIEQAAGWPPLSRKTIEKKQSENINSGRFRTDPLEIFSRLIGVKYGVSKGKQRVRVGFFNTRSWFKNYYGVGAATIASLHEAGRKSPKHGRRPLRPMIKPLLNYIQTRIPKYIERKFFKVFFRKRKGRRQ